MRHYEVHTRLGPGLPESSYRACLAHELRLRGIPFATETPLSLEYKGCVVDTAFRADIVVADRLLVELKSVEQVLPLHSAQLLTYLRVMRLPIGLLINFNVPRLRSGIRRIINRHALP